MNPHLSRYGVGCNVLAGFGSVFEITSRQFGSSVTSVLTADYDKWVESQKNGGIGWEAEVTHIINLDEDEGDVVTAMVPQRPFAQRFGTRICVKRLNAKVLESFRDADTR